MKLITFQRDGDVAAGYIDGDDAVVCAEGPGSETALLSLIAGGDAAMQDWKVRGTGRVPLGAVKLLAPIPEPRRDIFCVGKNYFAHAAEFHSSGFDSSAKEQIPSHPVIFTKATTSVCGPGDVVRGALDPTDSVDYECELAFVIGKRAFNVSRATLMIMCSAIPSSTMSRRASCRSCIISG